ncbi:MAG TPA: hypothetical protein VFJ74_05235 [Gemmatimonadaceae bacterium]|nr:hypothetical protein [Gemmatimonadaceae bacterium]
MLDESDVATLVQAYLRPDPRHPEPGKRLHELGPAVVPALATAYESAGRWQDRAALVVAATFHARASDAAVALGLKALGDRATVVRYRACGLLAYANRPDTLPALRAALAHPDARTSADAAAAIVAIETGNHHRFIDRAGVGNITWNVNAADGPAPERPRAGEIRAWWGRLRRRLSGR